MPIYQYRNPNTREVIEVLQKMKDKHKHVDEDGVVYERVWTAPNAAIDTQLDPHSESDFVNKTRDKKGTMGDLWDLSKDLSDKREAKDGKDSHKEKYFDKWSKKRKGKRHPSTGSTDILPI